MLSGIHLQANLAVCKADVSGATALSSSAASSDLYGTQQIGLYGKIRSWKAVSQLPCVFQSPRLQRSLTATFCYFLQIAVLQMLEKQIGPESFRKVYFSFATVQSCTTATFS